MGLSRLRQCRRRLSTLFLVLLRSVSNPLLYSLGRQYGDLEKSGLDELHFGMSLRAWCWKEGGTVSEGILSGGYIDPGHGSRAFYFQ